MLNHIKDHRNTFTVVVDGKSHQFDPTHPNYNALVDCVRTEDVESFHELLSAGFTIQDWSEDEFRFTGGVLYYVDEEVHSSVTNRIIDMMREGFDCKPILNFLKRVYQNPSYRAINELYTFLMHKALPITSDGYLLAYKAVNSDFTDKYSGTVDNSVGQTPTMPRFRVDDNCDVGCSKGLHVGAIDYVKSYGSSGDKVIICKIDPADVVSVPLDSDHQKMRVCKYEVVSEYAEDLLPAVVDEYDEEDSDDDAHHPWVNDDMGFHL